MPLVITGDRAAVRWGYQCAAVVLAWTVARDEGAGVWRLSGAVSEVDPFALTQGPLRFVATHKTGTWAWPIESVEVQGASSISAVLGRKER